MILTISTPLTVLLQSEPVQSLRAEDDSGAFGILPGHAEFLTVLAVSVLSWRGADGRERYAAVRGGTLQVRDGERIDVTSREALLGEDLEQLQTRVLAQYRQEIEQERTARSDAQKLYMAAVRQICRLLRPQPGTPG